MLYLLDRSRRPRLLRPARFKKRGGRANRRRCARWRRFPSDCRFETHSDMGTAVLCRNFSSGAFVSCSLRTREIRTRTNRSAEGDGSRRSRTGLSEAVPRLDGLSSSGRRLNLKHSRDDSSPCAITVRGGGCMLYGIIAIFDQVRLSNDAICDAAVCARPPARAPDRPLSTR